MVPMGPAPPGRGGAGGMVGENGRGEKQRHCARAEGYFTRHMWISADKPKRTREGRSRATERDAGLSGGKRRSAAADGAEAQVLSQRADARALRGGCAEDGKDDCPERQRDGDRERLQQGADRAAALGLAIRSGAPPCCSVPLPSEVQMESGPRMSSTIVAARAGIWHSAPATTLATRARIASTPNRRRCRLTDPMAAKLHLPLRESQRSAMS